MTSRDQALMDALTAAHRALEQLVRSHRISAGREVEAMSAALDRLEAAAQSDRGER